MTTWIGKVGASLLGVLLIFVAGMGTGWHLRSKKNPSPVKPQPAVVQQDGSVELAVKPDANAQPAQQMPEKVKIIRIVKVVVKPGPSAGVPGATSGSAPQATAPQGPQSTATLPCPPVQVDLTLVRMPDGTRRVIASSPNGQVDPGASMDIPVDVADEPRALKNAVGLVFGRNNTGGSSNGVCYDRDVFTRIRVGIEGTKDVLKNTSGEVTGWSMRLKAAWVF
jgi:hypothetical protein